MKKIKYELETPGFEGVKFTESSINNLVWPKAVKFAADQNAVLQSLREAVAFRIEAQGKDGANREQATRTGAIYFKDGNKFYVAFDDIPDPRQNIVLARAIEGYEANKEAREFILPKKDKQIVQLLKRAEKSDRIVQVVESPLELATKASASSSKFGSNKTVQAAVGDIAELYAGMLHERDYSRGVFYVLTPDFLDKEVADDETLDRPVKLGVDHSDGIEVVVIYFQVDIGAASLFADSDGRARGVRRVPLEQLANQ